MRTYISLRPTTIGNIIALIKGVPQEVVSKEDIKYLCKDDTRLMAERIQLIENTGKGVWKLTKWGILLKKGIDDLYFARKVVFMLMYKFLPQFRYMISLESSGPFDRPTLEEIGIDSYDSYLLTEKWGKEFGIIEKHNHELNLKGDEVLKLLGTEYIPSGLFTEILIKEYVALREKTKIRFVPFPKLRERLCIRLLIHQNYKYDIDQVICRIYRRYPYIFTFAAGDQKKSGVGLNGDRQKIHIAIDVEKLEEKNDRN
ncbi:MAG: hypothetical protein HXS54_03055 [Theionarchaea archaeon]|nr:hypothetical protein [Theionarchaea archaeon]